MEDAFNELWNVPNPRALYMQILKFSPAIIIFPCSILIAFTITGSENFGLLENVFDGSLLSWIGKILSILIPFLFTSAGLTILFKLVPYTNVSWIAAIWGGIIGGTFDKPFDNNITVRPLDNDFYGPYSLGLLPVFMLSLYFSCLIILYGALVAAQIIIPSR